MSVTSEQVTMAVYASDNTGAFYRVMIGASHGHLDALSDVTPIDKPTGNAIGEKVREQTSDVLENYYLYDVEWTCIHEPSGESEEEGLSGCSVENDYTNSLTGWNNFRKEFF